MRRAAFVSFAAIVEYVAHPPTLRCSGEEDRTTQAGRRQAVVRAIKAEADLVVDLGGLVRADPSLMLDLVMLARRLRAHGSTIALLDAQPQIAALLELAGLDRLAHVRIARSALA